MASAPSACFFHFHPSLPPAKPFPAHLALVCAPKLWCGPRTHSSRGNQAGVEASGQTAIVGRVLPKYSISCKQATALHPGRLMSSRHLCARGKPHQSAGSSHSLRSTSVFPGCAPDAPGGGGAVRRATQSLQQLLGLLGPHAATPASGSLYVHGFSPPSCRDRQRDRTGLALRPECLCLFHCVSDRNGQPGGGASVHLGALAP